MSETVVMNPERAALPHNTPVGDAMYAEAARVACGGMLEKLLEIRRARTPIKEIAGVPIPDLYDLTMGEHILEQFSRAVTEPGATLVYQAAVVRDAAGSILTDQLEWTIGVRIKKPSDPGSIKSWTGIDVPQ